MADDGPVLAIVRGEHQVHEKKIAHLIGEHRAAHPEEIREWFGADPGSLGPVGVDPKVRIIADSTLTAGHYVTGANRDGIHLGGVMLGRDFEAETADIRTVLAGEGSIDGDGAIELVPVIEIGNIFKLGVKYSKALGATYRGRPVGGFGAVGAFSFCQDKIVTTGGEGGMLATNDRADRKSTRLNSSHRT